MNTLIQLGRLLLAVSEIEGRKKLQKMVHILQEFGVPFEVRYGYHHYGPFSEQLQESVQSFMHDGLITETKVEGSYPTFRFKAETRLHSLLDLLGFPTPNWAGFATELNQKTPRQLEAVSTLIYLEKQTGKTPESGEVEGTFAKLKPELRELLPSARDMLRDFRQRFPSEKLAS